MTSALEARGLTWTPLGRPTPVLAGLDLRVEAGERVLVAGASGAGKSTLLRALAGVLGEAEAGDLAGEVTLGDSPVRAGDGRVGLVLQDPAAARVAGRVGRDVGFGPENLGVPRAEIHRRVADALRAVGFPYGPEHRTSALSGGEAQRLALAGVLAMEPQLVLLDEPTAMLDDASAAQVVDAVAAVVADRRVGLVVAEHRLDRWLSRPGLVDRLVVLGADGVLADGPPQRVLTERSAELLDAGIWLPGVPAPRPQHTELPVSRWDVPAGDPLLTLTGVGLVRRPLPGLSVMRRAAPTPALVDVDLVVPAARMTAVRGRSGAGKSSLLSVVAGLEAPTTGAVSASGALATDTDSPARWGSTDLARRISWVPQRAALTVVGSTVRDTLLATGRALGVPAGDLDADAERLCAALHLDGLEGRNPHTLSGGQLRRLALASALLHGPALLCLDEPTVGQDRHTWAAVAGIGLAALRAGTGVLVSTHDADLAQLADAVHVVEAGRLMGAAA